MKTNYIIGLLCLMSIIAHAQTDKQKVIPINRWSGDLAIGSGDELKSLSLALTRDFHFGKKNQWHLGVGWRNSTLWGSRGDYYSAPAEYWNVDAKTDTITVMDPKHFNSAVFVKAAVTVFRLIDLGFNIDLLGLSYGPKRMAEFGGESINQSVESTTFGPSLLLSGPRDIGMLKSEFYMGFRVTEQWMIRGGMSTFTSEYKTSEEIQPGNDRFRNIEAMPFLSLSYSW